MTTKTKPPLRPTEVRVLDKTIRVEPWFAKDNPENDFGCNDPYQQRILIHHNLALETNQETLLHEILHCCENIAGVPANEKWVTPIAPILLHTLKQNPDLVRFLLWHPSSSSSETE